MRLNFLTFGLASPVTRGVVHFFPSSERVSAPFPVACTIALFSQGGLVRTIALEGARLHHPDGVLVEELFEELGREITGLYGLHFQIDGGNQSSDVGSSTLLSEIRYQGDTQVRFFVPPSIPESKQPIVAKTAVMLRDAHIRSSLIVVNPSEKLLPTVLLAVNGVHEETGGIETTPVQRASVSPWSVLEMDIADATFDHGVRSERGLQRLMTAAVRIECEGASADTRFYVVYRDGGSGSVVSVAAL